MKVSKQSLLTLLVGGSIALGIAIIVVSLFANQRHWDRDTAVAAAKYDGTALLARIEGAPATAVDYPEVEDGPLTPDLRNVQEAWVAWRQHFTSDESFPAIVAWHRTRLPESEWPMEENPDKTTFRKGEWTLTLEASPDEAPKLRYRRILQWTRDSTVL